MYVMVIEDYPEEYLGKVRSKESILNYKERYWGYTEPKNEKDIADLSLYSEIMIWYAIIDLDKMEILTKEEELDLFNKYSSFRNEKKIILDKEWFYNQFNYNE